MAAGLAHLWGTPTTDTTQVLLIAGITGMALTSVVSGMDKGVKRLSEANLLLALLLLAFVLTVGPTRDIATGTVTSLGQYLAAIGPLSNWVGREDLHFMHGWTTFFWAWWISWSPFVGLFIARVSRGRTVRELIGCMLIIPTLIVALWMNAFGGTAVSQYVDRGQLDVIAAVQAQQPEIALFALLETLPLANVTSVIGLVLIVVFFVTSSDSGSLVLDTITAGGKLDAPVAQRVFWCVFEGLVAVALLLGGGLVAAQAATRPPDFPSHWCWSPCATAPGRGYARHKQAGPVNPLTRRRRPSLRGGNRRNDCGARRARTRTARLQDAGSRPVPAGETADVRSSRATSPGPCGRCARAAAWSSRPTASSASRRRRSASASPPPPTSSPA